MTGQGSTQQFAVGKAVPPAPPAFPPPEWAPTEWAPPGPPPRPRRAGLIGGVLVGAVLFAVVATGGVLAIRSLSMGGDQPAGQAPIIPPASAQPSSSPPSGVQPSAAAPAGGVPAAGRTHGYVANLCNVVDFSPAFAVLPASGAPQVTQAGGDPEWFATCTMTLAGAGSTGSLIVAASGSASSSSSYQSTVDTLLFGKERTADITGPWQMGRIGLGDPLNSADAAVVVLDGNLLVQVQLAINGPAAVDDGLQDPVVRIAQNVLTTTAVG
jgi:hypothetical protein